MAQLIVWHGQVCTGTYWSWAGEAQFSIDALLQDKDVVLDLGWRGVPGPLVAWHVGFVVSVETSLEILSHAAADSYTTPHKLYVWKGLSGRD